MYKQVMLLGLLLQKPMYGQQIREVIESHHEVFADYIKKPTIYYQLEKLANDGYLEVRRESVEAPGTGAAHEELALREREVYYITDAGRKRFHSLLREALSAYKPGLNDMDACLFFLHHLSTEEAVALLKERYELVARDRAALLSQMQDPNTHDPAHGLVNEHKLALLDAELSWLARTIMRLQLESGRKPSTHHGTSF